MYTILLRTLITYSFVVISVRIMGKRQIGELELSEFVTTLLLSELAAIPIADSTIPLAYSVIPILILLSVEMIISFIALKCRSLKTAVSGRPAIIISKGKINTDELIKNRLTLDELLAQLRLKDVFDISEVDYAILEDNGQLSVMKVGKSQTVTLEDMSLSPKTSGINHTVISDGQISDFGLRTSNHNRKWLKNTLKKKNLKIRDVFLMTVDDDGKITLIKGENQ